MDDLLGAPCASENLSEALPEDSTLLSSAQPSPHPLPPSSQNVEAGSSLLVVGSPSVNADHEFERLRAELESREKADDLANLGDAVEESQETAVANIEEDTHSAVVEVARLEADRQEETILKAAEDARLEAEEDLRLKAAAEARLQAEEDARLKAAEEARWQEQEDARLKAAEEARLKDEEDARLKEAEHERRKAAEEARLKAEEDERLKAEKEAKRQEDARLKAEEDTRLKAVEEARLKDEEDARLKAAEQARLRVEEDLRLKAAEEARLKAEEDLRLKEAEEIKLKAEQEAQLKAAEETRREEQARLKEDEEDARAKIAEEARLKEEEDERMKTAEQARLKAEEDLRFKAAEEARIKAEEDLQLKAAAEARLKAEEETRLKVAEEARWQEQEDARLKAAEEARLKAEEDDLLEAAERAKLKAEEDLRLKVAEETRLKAEEDRLKAEEDARLKAAEEARLKAAEDERRKAAEHATLKAEEGLRLNFPEETGFKDEYCSRSQAAGAKLKAEEAQLNVTENALIQDNESREAKAGAEEDSETRQALAEWVGKVEQQRNALNELAKSRTQIRATVEGLQQQITSLQAENSRLKSGGVAAALESRRQMLEKQLAVVESTHSSMRSRLSEGEADLEAAGAKVEGTKKQAVAAALELQSAETEKTRMQQRLTIAEQVEAAAEERLSGMVAVGALQKHEAECNRYKEEIKANEKEARQLRISLAEALSSGTDLPNTMQELTLLKESTAKASKRVEALDALNEQIRGRIAQLVKQNAQLEKGAFDLQNESELMREVIVQQNETLLRKVEDLTEERQTADADRKKLLETTADLLVQVDSAESRISKRKGLESESARMEAEQGDLISKIDRLRNSNRAYAQQVFDGDGPFAGALQPPYNCDVDRSIYEEVSRLLQGKPLHSIAGGDIKAEASTLSLRLQQTLAEREEAFWVERQKLSDRVSALERARGGRTGSLLREYDSAVRGNSIPSNVSNSSRSNTFGGGTSLAAVGDLASAAGNSASNAAVSAALSVTDGFQKLRGALLK